MEEKIIEKIKKLLNKQESAKEIGNLQEAEAFAAKVSELLMKYNLSSFDIKGQKEKSTVKEKLFDDITPLKNEGKWVFSLYGNLCRHNFCKLIVMDYVHTSKGLIIGEEENIDVVVFLGKQLESKVRFLSRKTWSEVQRETRLKKGKFIRGFLMGAAMGIAHKLERLREQQEKQIQNVTALVLVKDQKIEDYVKERFEKLGKARKSKVDTRNDGLIMGYEAGKNMEINSGIGAPNNPQKIGV